MLASRSLLRSWQVCMWWSWWAHVQLRSRQGILCGGWQPSTSPA